MKRSVSTLFGLAPSLVLIASVGLTSVAPSQAAASKAPTVLDEVVAKKYKDIEMIKKLINSDGESSNELAGAYAPDAKTKKSVLLSGETYFAAVVSSFALGDLNQDGIQDVAVAVELPAAKDRVGSFGLRQLRIYLSDASGALKLFRKADKTLLRRDFNSNGDEAFNAVQINSKTGSLIVSHLISNVSDVKTIQVDFKQRFVMKAGELVLANQREIHVGVEGTRIEDQDFENASQVVKVMKQVGGPSTVFKSKLSATSLTKIEDASISQIK